MKNFIKWSLCLLTCVGLTVTTAKAQDLPADIFVEEETHGKKHLRLLEIPPDEEANKKILKAEGLKGDACYQEYCLSRISGKETNCVIHWLPSWREEKVFCTEWEKGYDGKGNLRTYKSYEIDSETRERNRKYFVEWNENGQVSQICYYNYHICQHFDTNGKLIKDCYVGKGSGQCSEYNKDTHKWERTEMWMA